MKMLRTFSVVVLALSASAAWAAESDELVEKVVVRNRLFNVDGHFELGLNVGFSMLSRLTDHYNLNLSGAYNFADTLALELRVGYAISRHTGLANQIAQDFNDNASITIANDLQDLWEMTANGTVGLRWQPIYGKLGLMAELPVHYQAYVWVGGGAALFKRESVVICNQKAGKDCASFFSESKAGPVVSIALGFRFFITDRHAIKFEIRDYSYLDSYYVDVNRAAALNPANPTGNGAPTKNPGITNLVQFDLGYAFIF